MSKELRLASFWRWFFCGTECRPGFLRLMDRWICVHVLVGFVLAWLVQDKLQQCASSVLLPLAGVIVGLAFAWAGNAQALLQTPEIDSLAEHHEGGFVGYVYAYQTAIFVILASLVTWSLAGMSVFDSRWPTIARPATYFGVKAGLFALSSLALRECWHVVLGAQWMLLTRREIQRIQGNRKQ